MEDQMSILEYGPVVLKPHTCTYYLNLPRLQ